MKKRPPLTAGILALVVGLNFAHKGIDTIRTGVWIPGEKSSPMTGYGALAAGIIMILWGAGCLFVRWKTRLQGGK